MKKLTGPQVEALRYFQAIDDGLSADERRTQRIKYPAERVQDKLVDLGLVSWVSTENPLYTGPEGHHHPTMLVTRITDAGKALAKKAA